MQLFKNSQHNEEGLVKIASDNAVRMLEQGHTMFLKVTETLIGDTQKEDQENIKKMDKEINQLHRDVRRQVYEHLSLTGAGDLFFSLVLLSVVDDSERIGDHCKNIAEIIELKPGKCNFAEHQEHFIKIWRQTDEFFKAALNAFVNEDEIIAEQILTEYKEISNTCDGIIASILTDENKTVNKDLVVLIMVLRFFKRIDAHLKNVASTVINPYHRIGYKYKTADGVKCE